MGVFVWTQILGSTGFNVITICNCRDPLIQTSFAMEDQCRLIAFARIIRLVPYHSIQTRYNLIGNGISLDDEIN